MNGKIKSLAALMSAVMAFGGICGACGNPSVSDSSGDSGQNNSSSSGVVEPSGAKPVAMFEVDEGLGGYEFVAGCKTVDGEYDFDRMDVELDNIYKGIGGLQEKYDVAVHIYPQWYYKASGWNDKYSDGLQKWSEDFIYAMDYFKAKGIKVYLESLSSTVYVNQNGEEGSLPQVNVYDGTDKEEHGIWGVPCDFQSMEALKTHYPETFAGIRFHELIGTDQLAVAGNPHACRIYEEDILLIAEEVAKIGVDLVWSDWDWGTTFNSDTYAYWLTRVDKVGEILHDKLTVMLANNAGDIAANVGFKVYDLLAERFPDIKMGLSNQAWFLDPFILNDLKCESQTYIPIEVVAGFTQKAFKKGAAVVQFEPYFHLFNYTRQGINGGTDYKKGGIAMNYVTPDYELIQGDALDYSPRLELLRLVDYMNADDFLFENVEDFYDTSTPKMKANSINDPPVLYTQTTLCAVSDAGAEYFDTYNHRAGTWYNQNENRFTQRVIRPSSSSVSRISYTYGAFDDILEVSEVDGKNVGMVYNSIGGKVFRDTTTFADNADGEFVTFAAANLLPEKSYRGKDTDEIVVARKKGDKIYLSLYKANLKNDGFTRVTGASASVIDDFFGSSVLDAAHFAGIFGIRHSKAIGKTSCLRKLDGFAAVYADGKNVRIVGKKTITSPDIDQTLTLNGDFLAAAFGNADLDTDASDELFIAEKSAAGATVQVYGFQTSKTFAATGLKFSLKNSDIKHLCVFGKFYYLNDTSL